MEVNEAYERALDRKQVERHYARDLVQRLTFFVVGAELVFCGYVLLNAESLHGVSFVGEMYLASGVAAISGVLWRVVYNEEIHYDPGKGKPYSEFLQKVRSALYHIYLIASLVFFAGTLAAGYSYLKGAEDSSPNDPVMELSSGGKEAEPAKESNKKLQPTADATAE